jgi:hypothetical protein
MPVDNPENNVSVTCRRWGYIFTVPINHPFAHKLNLKDLIDAVNATQLLDLSTRLNNTSLSTSESTDIKPSDAPTEEEKVSEVETESFCAPEGIKVCSATISAWGCDERGGLQGGIAGR